MKPHHLAAALLAATCTAGFAQQSLKPGLWEITNRMQTAGGQMENQMAEMQKQMASMPPEQRKMMEDMMARQGVQMGKGPAGGMSTRICLTREMIDRNEVAQQRSDCKTTTHSKTGNTVKMAFTCTNPKSSGEGQITYTSPEAYNMKMVVNTEIDGRMEKVNMDTTGKWLSADCGNLKPMAPPAKQ
ncbi:MAG TPA: DUF3617 domain-containing protein [Acetobacteraceae bacterium]|nr:DUF3617 domain-containing protein [Acetobacteraceae bacterium]